MIVLLLKDPWTTIGSVGATLMMTVEWLTTHIGPVVGIIGGLLGLIMLSLTIFEKVIQIRKLLSSAEQKESEKNKIS